MYIYKVGTECDGAQMQVSDVYVPTLVALLGLCFDPSECFWDLRVWSRVVGNKSGKLRYMLRIMTHCHLPLLGDLPALTGHQAYPSASWACGSGQSQTWRGTGTIVPGGGSVCGPLRNKTSSYDPYGS